MKKDTMTVSRSLMIKALLLSFILLTIAFGLGLVIGRTDDSLQNPASADEGEIREQLSDCSFKLQEITAKHLSLMNAAKNKGLIDENGSVQKNIVCKTPDTAAEDISKDTAPDKEKEVKEIKESVEKKSADIKPENKEAKEAEKKTVEKKKPVKRSCSFSIQLFSDPDKDKAEKAKKGYPFNSKKLRLIEADIRGRNWYRIRYGCYGTRAEAELDLPEVKDIVDSAIVVAD